MKWWVESDFKAPNLPLSFVLEVSILRLSTILLLYFEIVSTDWYLKKKKIKTKNVNLVSEYYSNRIL